MPPEESTVATVETPVAVAPASTPEAVAPTPEPQAATLESQDTTLLEDVKAEREKLEAEAKTEAKPKAEAPKPAEEPKEGEEPEPEGLTDAEKNRAAWIKAQRDTQLQESAKLAEDRKTLEAERAQIEKDKAEIAAKQTAEPKKEEPKVDQPTPTALENFKPITLSSYGDGDNENEQALKTGIEALAKDFMEFKTAKEAEIETLKADNKLLKELAAPHIPDETGLTPAFKQGAAQELYVQAEQASEALMSEYGPESGLSIEPVGIMAALKEYGFGFVNIGEIKEADLLSKEAMLKCWRHANKTKIDELKAAPSKPKEEKIVPPPVRKPDGGNAVPPTYEQMSEREKTLHDLRAESALLAAR